MKRLSGGKNAQEQWIAYHEAGHAVAARLLGIRLGEVSLAPDETGRYRASTRCGSHKDGSSLSSRDSFRMGKPGGYLPNATHVLLLQYCMTL